MSRRMRWVFGRLAGLGAAVLAHPSVLEPMMGDRAFSGSSWLQSALMVGLAAALIVAYRHFLGPLGRYLHDHIVQAALLALLVGLICGLGGVFGLPDVIWGVSWYQRILSGMSATIVLAILGIIAFLLDERPEETGQLIQAHLADWGADLHPGDWLEPRRPVGQSLSRFLRAARLPFLLMLAVPALLTHPFRFLPKLEVGPILPGGSWSLLATDLVGLALWLSGIVAGVISIKFFLRVGDNLAPYVENVAAAGGGLSSTFRRQSSEVVAVAYAFADRLWDGVLAIWFKMVPDVAMRIHPTDRPRAHGPISGVLVARRNALISFTTVFALAYLGLATIGYDWVSPGVAVFALLGLAAALDGLVRLMIPSRLRILGIGAVLLWIGYMNQSVFQLQFDNLSYDERTRVELARHDPRIEEASPARPEAGRVKRAGQEASDRKVLEPSLGGQRLVSNQESLDAWLRRNPEVDGRKPKLTVVACSGGGMRGAHWAAGVLEWLDGELADLDFRGSIRLISASSGGSVGAGHYIKRIYDQSSATLTPDGQRLPDTPAWLEGLPRNSLSTVAPAIALREVPRVPMPTDGLVPTDRGKRLEMNWDHLRELPLEELRELERRAELPSLVVSPTVVEDGRRLFVSNLDLAAGALPVGMPERIRAFDPPGTVPKPRNISVQRGRSLVFAPGPAGEPDPADQQALVNLKTRLEQGLDLLPPRVQAEALHGDLSALRGLDPVLSASGFEFSKLFARERGFRLSTATRMAATFPFITPAVYLPTRPAVRVVDSGFRDNFGVEFAADWIFQNREWLQAHTSGVVLVQVRCFGDPENRRRPARSSGDWAVRGFQFLQSVPQAAANSFSTAAVIRNDRLLAQLGALLNEPRVPGAEPFFTTVVFDLPSFVRRIPTKPAWPAVPSGSSWRAWEASGGSVSWSLTESEARAIREGALPGKEDELRAIRRMVLIGDYIAARDHEPERRRRLFELRDAVAGTRDPDLRAALLWEFERARNYERLRALRRWWTSPNPAAGRP